MSPGQLGHEIARMLREDTRRLLADYDRRVKAYEAQGMTRSDAQAVVDAEDECAKV